MEITEAVYTEGLTMKSKDGLTAGQLLWEKGPYSEESFYFHVLDDAPPEDAIPLVFPELEQHLQVSIFLEPLFFPPQFHKI